MLREFSACASLQRDFKEKHRQTIFSNANKFFERFRIFIAKMSPKTRRLSYSEYNIPYQSRQKESISLCKI